jgi:hypothetical protein
MNPGKLIPEFWINKLPSYTVKKVAEHFSETLVSSYRTSHHHNPKKYFMNCFGDLYLMEITPSSSLQIEDI